MPPFESGFIIESNPLANLLHPPPRTIYPLLYTSSWLPLLSSTCMYLKISFVRNHLGELISVRKGALYSTPNLNCPASREPGPLHITCTISMSVSLHHPMREWWELRRKPSTSLHSESATPCWRRFIRSLHFLFFIMASNQLFLDSPLYNWNFVFLYFKLWVWLLILWWILIVCMYVSF